MKLVATSKSERDNCLDGEWQKAPSECEYAMGQRAAGLLVSVVDSGNHSPEFLNGARLSIF